MEMITIRTFNNYVSAHILLGRLEAGGIKAFLRDEYTVTIDPILTNAIGGIKVQVPANQRERALEVLDQIDKEYLMAAICPVCEHEGLDHIVKQTPTNFITAILTWSFSNYALATKHVYRCPRCGFETESLPEDND